MHILPLWIRWNFIWTQLNISPRLAIWDQKSKQLPTHNLLISKGHESTRNNIHPMSACEFGLSGVVKFWILRYFQAIQITIESIVIEPEPRCSYDALEISWEGGNHTMCGSIGGGATCSFVAEAGPIRVNLRTDSSVSRRGFSLSYSVAEPGTEARCYTRPMDNFVDLSGILGGPQPTGEPCGGLLTTPSGSIVSPNYPSHYDNDLDCVWVINVTQPAVR